MKKLLSIGLIVGCSLIIVSAASAAMLDDFEDGDLIEWTIAGSGGVAASCTAAAAHDGNYGAAIATPRQTGWLLRDDAQSHVEQGDIVSVWTALNSSSWTRNYFGFGSTAGGTYSLVLGDNTNTLILQYNAGYGYETLAEVPYVFNNNYWYRAEVAWDVGGAITGNLYDSDGVTLLATVNAVDNRITGGGIAMRTFGDAGDTGNWDTFTTEGATAVEPSTWGSVKSIYR